MENMTRHYWVGKVIHWEMWKKFKFDHMNKWYMHEPSSCHGEWHTQTPMELWHTKGSTNLGQKTRSYCHHPHHVDPSAIISLSLSRHPSLSSIASGRFSGRHPVLAQSCCMFVWAGRPAFAQPCERFTGVYHLCARPYLSSSDSHFWFV